MSIQYAIAAPDKEFKPTRYGIQDCSMDMRFVKNPAYKHRCPKYWIAKGWVMECKIAWIKEG